MFTLKILAKGWRHVPSDILHNCIPTTTGGMNVMECSHYERYFVAPLKKLVDIGVTTTAETTYVLHYWTVVFYHALRVVGKVCLIE